MEKTTPSTQASKIKEQARKIREKKEQKMQRLREIGKRHRASSDSYAHKLERQASPERGV